jgi:8-amino-7-oxononanoate synthase
MRTILVTGSDTGVGKTQVVAALARLCAAGGARVQVVKLLETGTESLPAGEGDAARACRLAGVQSRDFTLVSLPAPLAPAAAAAAAGRPLSLEDLVEKLGSLPDCDVRICEGAGGIATPVDDGGRDWADFGAVIGAEAAVVVVPDRLGAINQGRLAHARAVSAGLRAGVWLNAVEPVSAAVADSNRRGLRSAGVPLWAEQGYGALAPADPAALWSQLGAPAGREEQGPGAEDRPFWLERCRSELAGRDLGRLRRRLRVTIPAAGELNLADNDYLDLARDPAVTTAAARAAARHGASASASPLITGWREPHARLVEALGAWHGFSCGLLWSSGYAANSAVLGTLPRKGDLVLADRLVHASIVAGMLRSGARLQRYAHLRLDELERRLAGARSAEPGRPVFVVTESLFSMDGDCPDLARLAALKRSHGFCWILDEAHALGWYGPGGAGLARAAGVEGEVDVLVGTLGKTLASGGAYTLFHDEAARDFLVNLAGEFIYSTALPPANAAAAEAALERIQTLAGDQAEWQAISRDFRAALRGAGWAAAEGDSPIVPVRLDDEADALSLADALLAAGIRAGAVRPPTVPAGTSRLRFSLKRTFRREDGDRVLTAMAAWRKRR